MKLSVIVPCYNESENVSKLHGELLPVIEGLIDRERSDDPNAVHSAELIFVDDGSQDDTFSRLNDCFGKDLRAALTIKFLRHKINLGLGAAVRNGFSHAEGDIILTIDSDGTYPFTEISKLLAILTPEVDIVTASPYHPNGSVIGVPAYRLILSKGSSLIYRILMNWQVHTYTCLFRAYRSEVVRNVRFKSNGFLAVTEILIYAMQRGYRIAEFPTTLHRRMHGVSKAKILKTIFSHLKFQGWIILHRIASLRECRYKQLSWRN